MARILFHSLSRTDHVLSAPRLPPPSTRPNTTPLSSRPRRVRLHGGRGGGRLHYPVQLGAPLGPPPQPLSRWTNRRKSVSAPKADGLGRRREAARRGGGTGPRLGQARRRRAAALGAQGRGRAGAGSRAAAVLRVPARVRGHRHRRHRLHLRVHEPASGVRDHRLRQRTVRAAAGLLRLHWHPDLRISVVQGSADGEQGGRGARPQRRIHVTSMHLPVQKNTHRTNGVCSVGLCNVSVF